jgi:uncharacterized protein (UPF0147 family)
MNDYITQFEESLKEIESLISTPERIRQFAIESIKKIDRKENLTNVGKIKLQNTIKALENISDKTIKEHYQIIYNQLCVLAVSTLAAVLENYFIDFVQINWKEINIPTNLKIRLADLKEKYEMDAKKFLGEIIINNDSSINFQNFESIIRTFKEYCNKEIKLDKKTESAVTFYLQCRHVLVHKNGIVDEEFLNKTKSKRYRKGEKIKLNEHDWESIKESFLELVKKIANA